LTSFISVIGFSVDIDREDGAVLLTGRGEFDLAAVEVAEREIGRAEEGNPGSIVFDLSQVSFVDSSGLRVLLGAADRARGAGRRFVVARPSGQVARLLEMTGSTSMIDVAADLPDPFGVEQQA
jgi:anti-sigma B factor antagonist